MGCNDHHNNLICSTHAQWGRETTSCPCKTLLIATSFTLRKRVVKWCPITTLLEAIGSLGCRRNSSSGSVSNRQLTELQLITCSTSVESAGLSVNLAGYHWSPPSLCSGLRWCPDEWTENHQGQLHLNTRVFPVFHQLIQLHIDRTVMEISIQVQNWPLELFNGI